MPSADHSRTNSFLDPTGANDLTEARKQNSSQTKCLECLPVNTVDLPHETEERVTSPRVCGGSHTHRTLPAASRDGAQGEGLLPVPLTHWCAGLLSPRAGTTTLHITHVHALPPRVLQHTACPAYVVAPRHQPWTQSELRLVHQVLCFVRRSHCASSRHSRGSGPSLRAIGQVPTTLVRSRGS